MKVKLINEKTKMLDKHAQSCSVEEYDRWIKGEGISLLFTSKTLSEWKWDKGDYRISAKKKAIVGDNYDHLYFTFSDRQSTNNYLFVDIDFKNMLCDDAEKDKIKNTIETLISFDNELNKRVYRVSRSGITSKNGLHIIIKGEFQSPHIKGKVIKNIARYLQNEAGFDLHLLDKDVLDTSSITNMRWIKAIFNVGFSFENNNGIWSDFDFGAEPDKLVVPNTYTSGFHNELYKYLCKTQLSKEDLFILYKNDLDYKPFNNSVTLKEEIERLYKYTEKFRLSSSEAINSNIFYLDDKGNKKINLDNMLGWLKKTYNMKYIDGIIYMREINKKIWTPYYFDKNLKTWSFIPELVKRLSLDMNSTKLFNDAMKTILVGIQFDNEPIKRDLDTHESIVFNINNGTDYNQITIKEDSVKITNIEKDFIDGSSIYIPYKKLNIIDYKDWDVYKSGFFHNITTDYEKLINIIGYTIHMNYDNFNGNRILVLTDAINDDGEQAGTGKSLLAKIIRFLRCYKFLDAQINNPSSSFFLQQLELTSQIIHIDEFPRDGNIQQYRKFTEPITVEHKFQSPFVIQPIKTIICSNYLLSDYKADSDRRIEVSFTRFYERKRNPLNKILGYRVLEDTRLQLGEDFKVGDKKINVNDWWCGYISFMAHCAQTYLKNRNEYIENIMNVNLKYEKQIEIYQNNDSIIYEQVIGNLKKIISTNASSYKISNKSLCNTHQIGNKKLSIVHYILKNYLPLYTNYEYTRKIKGESSILHEITKIK